MHQGLLYYFLRTTQGQALLLSGSYFSTPPTLTASFLKLDLTNKIHLKLMPLVN